MWLPACCKQILQKGESYLHCDLYKPTREVDLGSFKDCSKVAVQHCKILSKEMLLFGEHGNVCVHVRRIHQIKVYVQAFEKPVSSQGRAVIKGVYDLQQSPERDHANLCHHLSWSVLHSNLGISFPLPVHGTSLSKHLNRCHVPLLEKEGKPLVSALQFTHVERWA